MKYPQKSHSNDRSYNMTVGLVMLLSVFVFDFLAVSLKAQTKTSGEQARLQTAPGRNGKIAFTSTRDGDFEIYTMEADGSNQTRLTNNVGYDSAPKWSPDGTKIAFARSIGFLPGDIYVMHGDGSNQRRLTTSAGSFCPMWSPDGKRIMFESDLGNNTREIFVVNDDGTNLTRLTNSGDNSSPSWSPDGTRIVFYRFGSAAGIYLMNADGSNQTQLNADRAYSPKWSPDSSHITFVSNRDGNDEIYVMNSNGANQTRLTNNPGLDDYPEWSPDGARIMFRSFRDNEENIYVMNADGSNQTRLTDNPDGNEYVSPIFSPDGTRITFPYGYSFVDELIESQIYAMNADGSNVVKLTNSGHGVYEIQPDWQVLPATAANPIDTVDFFVRQHYRDFLNREPDTQGLSFWTNEITSCGGDAQCAEVKRINVSAAYFLSIEFQQTGYLVYRIYKASFGNLSDIPNAPVPIKREEFLPDTQEIGNGVIVNQGNWQQQLEANKQAFTLEFVQRSRFTSSFAVTMTPAQFVDRLFSNAGVVPTSTDRNVAISEFGSATTTDDVAARSRALRDVSENATLNSQEFNKAFVLMQYFAYMRRNPYDPPEASLDYSGFNFWLGKLNQFNGNYIDAEMVKAFINSTEYRQRFGP